MACRPPTPELGLLICIYPRAHTRYYGTAEQLVAEGLIPKDFEWPHGRCDAKYTLGRFTGFLHRCRPPGMKGPMSQWVSGDYWSLNFSPTSELGKGFMAHTIYEKGQELLDTLRRSTPEWSVEWNKAHAARKEPKYAAFRALLIGDMEKRGRGRPAKAIRNQQGASHA